MLRNGLPPHCSWEIDRQGNRRIRFRWRKVSRSITNTPGGKATGAATTKRPSGATLGARSENGARKQNRKTRKPAGTQHRLQ
jgi:hypothetical protein